MSSTSPQTPMPQEKRRRDFGLIERALEPAAMDFARRLRLAGGERVLDVGCGAGKCSIAAAQDGGDVTGVDAREPFLSRARAWAKNTGLLIRFQRVAGTRLPFSDRAFHASMCFLWLSVCPDPPGVVAEMRRVTRRDGTIALALWHPDGMVARTLRTAYQYSGDEALARALQWLDERDWQSALGLGGYRLEAAVRDTTLAFPFDAREVAQCYVDHHPAMAPVVAALAPDQREHLVADFVDHLRAAGADAPDRTEFRDRYRVLLARC